MKLRINESQLQVLTSNFVILENGLQQRDANLITESMKQFKIKMFFGSWLTEIMVGAHSPASAFAIVKRMFPHGRVTANITAV